MKHLVAPSILSADFANLADDIKLIDQSDADWVHVDVMDGRFVPNISFGFPVIKAVRPYTNKPFDVHLMIEDPDQYFKEFKDAGADILTIHYEASTHLHRSIQAIKGMGMKAGVSLNPHTPVPLLKDVISDLDLVLIMSVNPGYGGQSFIENTYNKIHELRQLIHDTGSSALIEVDGGIGPKNAGKVLRAGANVLVAGSSIFKTDDPRQAISTLKHININTIEV